MGAKFQPFYVIFMYFTYEKHFWKVIANVSLNVFNILDIRDMSLINIKVT